MEASFGFAERLARLVDLRRKFRAQSQALLAKPEIPGSDKQRLSAQLSELDADIAKNEAERERWNGDLRIFMSYLTRRGFLEGAKDLSLITTMSAEVRKDQQAVAALYQSCVRQCAQPDFACRSACDTKANASDPNRRMLRCHDRTSEFK